ncbi:EF-hand domain-containing protein [Gellertiella hungarica]|uniref:Ca2+-binding EF-hand superfamily protein n=1 Tax=Gellertiella hungarica TaxID=1572859 RepID=A0A7W6J634_9HYPH|nr:EF-hand domain-containing protein [Gellertiella hungarica]MBB4065449.1 Ca2+-binding EF-hand superfamily protein [Gellertiella hungarica]
MNVKLLACLAAIAATGSACAADGQKARQAFRQMDRNGDRTLQFTEIEAARAALFDRLDANRNGILEKAEAEAALLRMREEKGLHRMAGEGLTTEAGVMDADGDGRLTRSEFSRFIPDRVRRADSNGDAALSLSELRAARRR